MRTAYALETDGSAQAKALPDACKPISVRAERRAGVQAAHAKPAVPPRANLLQRRSSTASPFLSFPPTPDLIRGQSGNPARDSCRDRSFAPSAALTLGSGSRSRPCEAWLRHDALNDGWARSHLVCPQQPGASRQRSASNIRPSGTVHLRAPDRASPYSTSADTVLSGRHFASPVRASVALNGKERRNIRNSPPVSPAICSSVLSSASSGGIRYASTT